MSWVQVMAIKKIPRSINLQDCNWAGLLDPSLWLVLALTTVTALAGFAWKEGHGKEDGREGVRACAQVSASCGKTYGRRLYASLPTKHTSEKEGISHPALSLFP